MITKDYVSVKVAQLLNDDGFIGDFDYAWFKIDEKIDETTWNRHKYYKNSRACCIPCPSIWQADQYIQDKFGLFLSTFHTKKSGWWGIVTNMDDATMVYKMPDKLYLTRDELYNDYIEYCLKNAKPIKDYIIDPSKYKGAYPTLGQKEMTPIVEETPKINVTFCDTIDSNSIKIAFLHCGKQAKIVKEMYGDEFQYIKSNRDRYLAFLRRVENDNDFDTLHAILKRYGKI